ncbi:hypothetical protein Bca52824_073262 [Brassica carinata]|uniref:Zinc knuckle CX2CX4HX4C domain-containing protein n=1 Tax=Brassica carinata TaxID=52824 RepID=A0A8X7QA93_BRACI|nr:hypothetical protein Bca52824_073262 [Brassica carinata]
MCEDDDNFLCGVILDFGIFSLSDLMGVEILRAVVILEDQFLGGSGQIRYYGNVSPRLEVENENLEVIQNRLRNLQDQQFRYVPQLRIWYVTNLLMVLIGEFRILHIRFSIPIFISSIAILKTLLKLIDLGSTMSQNQWIVKSGGKKGEVVKSGLRVTVPRFDNSELIASFSKTLIGRCMNPQKQDMKILFFMLPMIWNVEGRVVGTDLGLGRFQVLDLPLQFRAAETLQSVGQAIGIVQGQMDLIGGRIQVEVDGFKPLVFTVKVDFEEGVEVTVALRYEKLFGFCRECYMLTHEQSRCPPLAKEDIESFMVGGFDGDGAGATSYKAVVANDTKQLGERREAHYNHSQAGRGGDKDKGIVRESQGAYRQEGSFHPYKGKHPRGYGDGASYQGRYTVRNDEGDQLLQDPNKLMLDAFKGVRRSPVAGTVNKVGSDGTGASSSKVRKTLLFEEPAPTIQIVTTDQDVVAVGDTPAMQEIPVVQKQGEVEEETKLAEERSLY